MKTIVLGGGCFWCLEAVYQRVKGVEGVRSGFAGGSTDNPDYHNHTDHAEVVEVFYDETTIDLATLLEIFFHIHDPTTLNRQGHDIGTQYRSIVLYNTDDERNVTQSELEKAQADWDDPIATEIKKLDEFYEAEDLHQDYYNQNRDRNPYCQVVIDPKLAKFHKKFAQLVKEDLINNHLYRPKHFFAKM